MPNYRFKTGDAHYYLCDLDAGGYFEDPDDDNKTVIPTLQAELRDAEKDYTDVVIVSHGYMQRKNEDGSINFANAAINAIEKQRPENIRPLYVAIFWPSFVGTFAYRAEEDNIQRFKDLLKAIREGFKTSDDSSDSEEDESLKESIQGLEQCVEKAHPDQSVGDLKKHVAELVSKLEKEGAKSTNKEDLESILDDGKNYTADVDKQVQEGHNKAVKEHRVQAAYLPQDATTASVAALPFSAAVARVLEEIIFGQFERRASNVGSRGVHALVTKLMQANSKVKFHLLGHSLGGHVVASGAIGRRPGSLLPRKIHSMMILQGALDCRSMARGGGYRPIVTYLRPVAGPVVATTSPFDKTLRVYDVFHNTPLGLAGFKDTAPVQAITRLVEKVTDGKARQVFDFKSGELYVLDGTNVITEGGPFGDAHGDILDPEVMQAFWQSASTVVSSEGYVIPTLESLPANYWSRFNIRAENDFWKWCAGCCIV